jgi:N-acetylmuramoyl-L-alanine amidase
MKRRCSSLISTAPWATWHRAVASCLVICGAALSSAGAGEPASATLVVRAIRHWAAAGSTRVVLDVSGRPRYRIKALANPNRILIEIPECRFAGGVKEEEVADGVLDRIRIARSGSEADIILDLPRETPYAHFVLKPFAGKPDRIVIDLKNTLPGAPVAPKVATPVRSPDIVVVIDPGHGGGDPGAISRSGVQEKTLNLKLARMLKAAIERNTGFKAVLVRDGDYNVEWYRRITFAREHNGDCFVSLHFNTHPDRGVRGMELYFLSLKGATDENAERVAEQENLMLDVGEEAEAFNDDLKSILFDVSQANALQQSAFLAEEVSSVMRRNAPIPFRNVKQANFIVLRGIAMPSILVEGAYLTNRSDAALVQKESFLQWLAGALSDGIVGYFKKYPRTEGVSKSP